MSKNITNVGSNNLFKRTYSAKNIELLAKKFEQNYAVRDKQDVLAMCALQFASKIEQSGINESESTKEAKERLISLDQWIHSQLGTE